MIHSLTTPNYWTIISRDLFTRLLPVSALHHALHYWKFDSSSLNRRILAVSQTHTTWQIGEEPSALTGCCYLLLMLLTPLCCGTVFLLNPHSQQREFLWVSWNHCSTDRPVSWPAGWPHERRSSLWGREFVSALLFRHLPSGADCISICRVGK